MPIRRLNFTKRRRIMREDVSILLHTDASPATFDANLSLERYGFPPDARVFVEAYRQTTLIRFDYGSVGKLLQPPRKSLEIFESPEAVLFRVRVTSDSGRRGLLLGLADKIPARRPDEVLRKPIALLPPIPRDLGEETWRVEFCGDQPPNLAINNQLPDWKRTVCEPQFRATAFPAAMRLVLHHILYVDGCTETDDDQDWRSLWLRFASTLPGSSPVPSDSTDYSDWIDDTVAAFARKTRLRTSSTTALEE